MGRLDTTVSGLAIVQDGHAVCLLSQQDAQKITQNMAVEAAEGTGIVMHAPGEPQSFERRTSMLLWGMPLNYDPTQQSPPDTSLAAEERKIGGLGIFMVKKVMDSMVYEYRDGLNLLTLTKHYS